MMKKTRMILLSTALCGSMLLSGCSARQMVNRFLDRSAKGADQVISTSSEAEKEPAMMIDESLNKPVFENDLTGSISVVQGSLLKLETAASVSDNGTITYQWYCNNVSSNGGGTVISGATDPVYTVNTSEAGTTFYYVVATNAHGDAINMSVSGVYQVTVWPAGEWKETEEKFQYVMEDGTFPTDTRLLIEDTIFVMDAEGYRTDEGLPALETMKGETVDAEAIQAEADAAAAEAAAAEEARKAEEEAKKAEEKAKKKAEKKKKKQAEEAAKQEAETQENAEQQTEAQ